MTVILAYQFNMLALTPSTLMSAYLLILLLSILQVTHNLIGHAQVAADNPFPQLVLQLLADCQALKEDREGVSGYR